jgi:hypothetical protein
LTRWSREVALLGVLYVLYDAARYLVRVDRTLALGHGADLLRVERVLHLAVEEPANAWLSRHTPLAIVASYLYAVPHYVVTAGVLCWLYRRREAHYGKLRNALLVATVLGLGCYLLVPVAPPRMLPGFADTLADTSAYGWWGADASAPRGLGGFTNEFAAMPSLHVGWAVWVAWAVGTAGAGRWATLLAGLYPGLITVVVLATANHFALDAVGGVAVLAGAVTVTSGRSRARATSGVADDETMSAAGPPRRRLRLHQGGRPATCIARASQPGVLARRSHDVPNEETDR